MQFQAKELLERYKYNKNPSLTNIREQVYNAIETDEETKVIINKLLEEHKRPSCSHYDQQPFYCTFIGVAYYRLGQFEQAVQWFNTAAMQFRGKDDKWNEAVTSMSAGIAYKCLGDAMQAVEVLENAKHVITTHILTHSSEYLTDAKQLASDIDKLIAEVNAPTSVNSKENEAYMAFFGLPVYPGVQAGPGGPMLIRPGAKTSHTDTKLIYIEGKLHKLLTVVARNQQITINGQFNYGWAKVAGDSMNGAYPTPIIDGNYVLFYESDDADDNAIIIASWLDINGIDLKLIVKRYGKNDQCLYSDTTPPNRYNPISIQGDVKILGIVVAVAKPV